MKRAFKIGCFSVLGLFVLSVILAMFGVLPDPPVKDKEPPTGTETRPQETMGKEQKDFLKKLEKADYYVRALELIEEYAANVFAADAKYKGKNVIVRGDISNMYTLAEKYFVNLESVDLVMSVSCQMKKSTFPILQQLIVGQNVVVVGKVTGSEAGLIVNLEDCLIMSSVDYYKTVQQKKAHDHQ
ncbi:MAG: hypothetical protein OYL97_19480 [Candidatus Poribacteria bacterium]|nr:hypothetical protein [Candidatus Poribacteria bacterium]